METEDELPFQLQRNSKSSLSQRFTRSVDLLNEKGIGWEPHTQQTRELVSELCEQFQQCKCEPGCVYCNSGQEAPTRRGQLCSKCIAGQVSKKGRWLGPDNEISEFRGRTLRETYRLSRVTPTRVS